MAQSRTYNVIANSFSGIVASVISIVVAFVVRYFLSKTLGAEIYGINGLFNSIIATMLIMEIGISSAVVIHLYGPIASGDKKLVAQIIGYYRKMYTVLCLCLWCVGIILTFTILKDFVHSTIGINVVRYYFVILLVGITSKYFFSYKRAILYADQKNRVCAWADSGVNVCFSAIEVLVIVLWQRYDLFLVSRILQYFVANYICIKYVNRHYPYLRKIRGNALDQQSKHKIFDTLKPLFVQRISGTIQDTSVGLLIGLLGKSVVYIGMFSNYQMIMQGAQTVFSQCGGALTSSFGNLNAEDTSKLYSAYNKTRVVFGFIIGVIVICFFNLSQEFIFLVFGGDYLFDLFTLGLITVYLYVMLSNVLIISIQNALGLHRLDAKMMVVQTVVMVVLAWLLGREWGINGILCGCIVPLVCFTTLYKNKVVLRYIYLKAFGHYVRRFVIDTIKIAVSIIVTYLIVARIPLPISVGGFILKVLIVGVMGVSVMILMNIHQIKSYYGWLTAHFNHK